MEKYRDSDKNRQDFANYALDKYRFIYCKAPGDDPEVNDILFPPVYKLITPSTEIQGHIPRSTCTIVLRYALQCNQGFKAHTRVV